MEVFVGGAEGGITPVGASAQRHFQVADGDVGRLYLRADEGEAGRVVVGALRCAGGIDLRLMLHQVAHKQQRNPLLCGEGYAIED